MLFRSTITAVPTSTTFKYTQAGVNATASGGSVIKGDQTSFILRNSSGDSRIGRIVYANDYVGRWSGEPIRTTSGGTGLTGYAAGDIIYASAANTLAKLAKGTDGQVLKLSGGVPTWGTDNDTDTVTRLRTGGASYVSGDIILSAGSNVTITQIGNLFSISSSYTDTNTWDANALNVAGYVAEIGRAHV